MDCFFGGEDGCIWRRLCRWGGGLVGLCCRAVVGSSFALTPAANRALTDRQTDSERPITRERKKTVWIQELEESE